MEKIKPGMLYIAVDGDGIGKLVGRAVIANDVEELHKVSARIDAAQEYISHWCEVNDGVKISGGGDEGTMAIPPEAREKIKELRAGIEKSFGYTISAGVGKNLSEAGTALLVAKLRGKNRVVYFNKHIKEDIKKAKRRVREKRATPDEYKLSEAYLKKSEYMLCKLHKSKLEKAGPMSQPIGTFVPGKKMSATSPSKGLMGTSDIGASVRGEDGKVDMGRAKREAKVSLGAEKAIPKPNLGKVDSSKLCKLHKGNIEDNETDDSEMSQHIDAQENADGTAGMHNDCPACQEYDEADQNTGHIDNCPYCQDENADSVQHDDNCECPWCNEYDQEQSNVEAQDMGEDHPDNCPECQEMYGDAVESSPEQTGQGDPNLQGHETAEEVLDLLDQEPGQGSMDPTQEARQIDNTEMPQGDQMRDNVAVKDNFGAVQAQDISDADKDFQEQTSDQQGDDQPDMMGVLQGGLQDGEDQAQRERVVNMVSQTLQQFKANKQSLEATRDQNEGLYTSCIQMLKSMIELCKLLGLEPSPTSPNPAPAPQQAPNDQGAIAEATQSGAPTGPKQAAPAEGAAPDPKTQG